MINAATGFCIFPLCTRKEEREGFCFLHAPHFAGAKPDKTKQPIAKQSDKRKKEQRVYRKIVKAKVEESEGLCLLKGPTCTGFAEGGDHKQKRSPANFIKPENIIPACNACNRLKEVSPELFKENVVSRFTPMTAKD